MNMRNKTKQFRKHGTLSEGTMLWYWVKVAAELQVRGGDSTHWYSQHFQVTQRSERSIFDAADVVVVQLAACTQTDTNTGENSGCSLELKRWASPPLSPKLISTSPPASSNSPPPTPPSHLRLGGSLFSADLFPAVLISSAVAASFSRLSDV